MSTYTVLKSQGVLTAVRYTMVVERPFITEDEGLQVREPLYKIGKGKAVLPFLYKMSKRPGLIVFDLDCTLWPFHVDSTVNPPFSMKGKRIVDKYNEDITCYPEVPTVLEYLMAEGYLLAAASRTTKPEGAKQLLELFDWNKYFKYKEIYPGCKINHFRVFAEETQLPYSSILFFDDEMRNIRDMEGVGVKCILVQNGVNMQLIKDSIKQFEENKL